MQYNEILAAGAAGLDKLEFWCIVKGKRKLIETASKDFTQPVRMFCDALNIDWDDATEQGWSLGRVTLTEKQLAKLPTDRLLGGLAAIMATQ